MANLEHNDCKLDIIEVTSKWRHLQIREIDLVTGVFHRRVITPDMDVSDEVQEIQDTAEAEWTDEVKTAWNTFAAEQEAERDEMQARGEERLAAKAAAAASE